MKMLDHGKMEGFKEGFEKRFGGKGWMECGRIVGGVGIGKVLRRL